MNKPAHAAIQVSHVGLCEVLLPVSAPPPLFHAHGK
jgi:hypothetical protein